MLHEIRGHKKSGRGLLPRPGNQALAAFEANTVRKPVAEIQSVADGH